MTASAPWPCSVTPVWQMMRALRVELHGDAVLGGYFGAADAVKGGRRIGHLDEAREADAAISALRAQPLLLRAQSRVVHHGIEMSEAFMVRQRLELDPGGAARWVCLVGNEIAAPDLQRVHADLRGRELDQPFRDRRRNGMPDRAVLTHDILVLKHHAGAGAIVRAGVRAAGEIDDLVRLDARRARIDRIRPDAGKVVDLPGGDGAVVLHADLRLDPVVAGVNVGDEALDAVGDELDRALEQLRKRDRRHLVRIGVHLDAERAADVLGDDAHLVLLEAEMLGEEILHHVRRLRALIDGQPRLGRVPIGDDGARLVGHAGMATEHERRFHDRIGQTESLVGIARDVRPLEGEVVAKLGMDDRRAVVERSLGVGHRRQLVVADLDELARVLRFCARARDHGADCLALPACALDRDRVLRRRFDAFEMGEHARSRG